MPVEGLTTKGRATRQRIIAAAARLIDQQGATATTIEDVREAAAVSASQLYHYFTDKHALVGAVIDHQAEAIVGAQPELDSMAAFEAWRDHVVAMQAERGCAGGCPLGSLSAELAERDHEARADLAAAFDRWEAAFRRGLAAMREAGRLRPSADPDRLAVALLASLQGGLLLAQARRDTAPLEVALDTVLDRVRAEQVTA